MSNDYLKLDYRESKLSKREQCKKLAENFFKEHENVIDKTKNYQFSCYLKNEKQDPWNFFNCYGQIAEIQEQLAKVFNKYGTVFYMDSMCLTESREQ